MVRGALRRGVDLSVSMLGRWAVWPVMSALALALLVEGWVLDVVLYVGLATNLRERMEQHLDDPKKTSPTEKGRAVWFHWIQLDPLELERVERSWLNIHEQLEAVKPILNSIHSPVRV